MLSVRLATSEIPFLYAEFAEIIGERHWIRRVQRCEEEIRGNSYLADFLREENTIAYQLAALNSILEKNRWHIEPDSAILNLYPAAAFMSQALSLIKNSSSPDRHKLVRRIHGAFSNPDDLRGLLLEFAVATHFIQSSCEIVWPETSGIGTFDLLCILPSSEKLEVECKSISTDKGRKIHQREAREFYGLLKPLIRTESPNITSGLSVTVSVLSKLPNQYKERTALAKKVAEAITSRQSLIVEDTAKIDVKEFSAGSLTNAMATGSYSEVRKKVEEISETSNKNNSLEQTKGGGLLLLTIQSEKDDSLLDTMFDTLKTAADKQLSKKTAGVIVAELYGITEQQMRELAQIDATDAPTSLRKRASQFLNSNSRSHVTHLCLLSRSNMNRTGKDSVSSSAANYVFDNRFSPFWTEKISGYLGLDAN